MCIYKAPCEHDTWSLLTTTTLMFGEISGTLAGTSDIPTSRLSSITIMVPEAPPSRLSALMSMFLIVICDKLLSGTAEVADSPPAAAVGSAPTFEAAVASGAAPAPVASITENAIKRQWHHTWEHIEWNRVFDLLRHDGMPVLFRIGRKMTEYREQADFICNISRLLPTLASVASPALATGELVGTCIASS